ncbi:hypothetical protein BGZ47_008128 [Haplosporangium gracile]|nr:hypothetical protein BGZ47_008128 [Haplosporangium gracile]
METDTPTTITISPSLPPPPSNHRSHMKRLSSTFCIPYPQQYPYPDSSTTTASSPIDTDRDNLNDDDDDEQLRLQPSLKRRSLIRRPWTNAEQESLYVAVERLKLFGRWGEVKTRMNLDRSCSEIEEEYNRLYAEIPDSEYEDYMEDDDENEDEEDEGMYSGELLVDDNSDNSEQAQAQAQGTRVMSDVTLLTPALTATSSAAQSTHSSQENLASLFGMAKAAAAAHQQHQQLQQLQQQQQLKQSLLDQRRPLPPPPPPPLNEQEDEYDEGYEDYEDHLQQQQQQLQQHDQQSNCPQPYHHQQPHTQHQQPHTQHQQGHRSTASCSSTTSTTRPARMVRVWTPEQSEALKNLVEVYFPGAYRINWVWVAAQMGNAFTRKQCKNKWEIMRRRMGTEDEILLLKRGYQEFGPSWGQIQEKYLPERSRGGISIMWELLETREAELAQQSGSGGLSGSGPGSGGAVVGAAGSNGGGGGGGGGGTSGMMTMTAGPGSAVTPRKTLSHHRRNSSLSSVKSTSLRVNISKDGSTGTTHRQRTSTVDIDTMDLSSPTTALYTLTEEMTIGSNPRTYTPSSTTTASRPYQHRKSASVSSMTSISRYGHGCHGSDVTLSGEWGPSERMMPMTWTEPLTRRLQDLVREHVPSQSKVNWTMISSLMGCNPVVSKDQCKRRWYLISQQQQQLLLQQQQQQQQQQLHTAMGYRQQQPDELLCHKEFSDADVPILQRRISRDPSRLRYLSLSIKGLNANSIDELRKMVCSLHPDIDIRIERNGDEDQSWHEISFFEEHLRHILALDMDPVDDYVQTTPDGVHGGSEDGRAHTVEKHSGGDEFCGTRVTSDLVLTSSSGSVADVGRSDPAS